jgi:hypothetical protein
MTTTRVREVFRIGIEPCERCGGRVRIVASIEDPEVIGRILAHLQQSARQQLGGLLGRRHRSSPVPRPVEITGL